MYKIKSIILLLAVICPGMVLAQGDFPNTMTYHADVGSPMADLSATSWLTGHWRGEAFGGITEEVWTAPLGGSMMGSFKLVVDDKVNFYALMTISEVEGTLILRLKHFNANLTGWEAKDETVDIRLVKVTPNKVFFDAFTFEKVSENEINTYVVIDRGGQKTESRFNYKKES